MTMWLKPGETAARLGISRETLRRWDVEGVFHATWETPGGHRRYDADKVARFVIGDDAERVS